VALTAEPKKPSPSRGSGGSACLRFEVTKYCPLDRRGKGGAASGGLMANGNGPYGDNFQSAFNDRHVGQNVWGITMVQRTCDEIRRDAARFL
jgi:hypothetical protein